jgi:hypothetical protein
VHLEYLLKALHMGPGFVEMGQKTLLGTRQSDAGSPPARRTARLYGCANRLMAALFLQSDKNLAMEQRNIAGNGTLIRVNAATRIFCAGTYM